MSKRDLLRPGIGVLAILVATVVAAEPQRVVLEPDASELSFLLDTTLHEVHGTLSLESGEIVFDTDTGEASGELVVDASRAETGNAKRDKKMHRSVLETDLYPRIVFHPARVEGRFAPAGPSELSLVGTMSIHGTVHPMTLPIVVDLDGDRVRASTNFKVPYVEWGMENPSLLVLRVAKQVEISIRTEGRLYPATVAAGGGTAGQAVTASRIP